MFSASRAVLASGGGLRSLLVGGVLAGGAGLLNCSSGEHADGNASVRDVVAASAERQTAGGSGAASAAGQPNGESSSARYASSMSPPAPRGSEENERAVCDGLSSRAQ